jgi:hypothetical protein
MMTVLSDLTRAIDVGLTVLTHRLLTLLALAMVSGLFCWSMVLGTIASLITAGAFGLIIFLPILAVDRRPEARYAREEDRSEP